MARMGAAWVSQSSTLQGAARSPARRSLSEGGQGTCGGLKTAAPWLQLGSLTDD